MLPADWVACPDSEAIEAYRYLAGEEILQIAYVSGRKVYDFPCPASYYEAFLSSDSRGGYVQHVLRPYARHQGRTPAAYPWPW